MTEKFTSFYTSRPFWAGNAIDFDAPEVKYRFNELMSAAVFSYDNDAFNLRICKDGMVMLRVPALEAEISQEDLATPAPIKDTVAWWGRYLDYLNCLYLLLDSALIQVDQHAYFDLSEITNKDAFRVHFENGEYKGEGIAMQSIASYYQMGRYASSYRDGPRFDTRILHRFEIKRQVFDILAETFSIAVANEQILKSLAALAKSIAEYKVGNYATSLVLSWFVCESRLSAKWRSYLDESNEKFTDGSKRVSSDRRQTLTGRDYPISVVSYFLELTGQLSFETFRHVDAVRGFRNKVVHQAKDFCCGASHCREAIELALSLTAEDTGIDVKLNLGFSITGP